jgi:hypothetical protein
MYDRVRETSVTSGTGAVSLAGAVTGYQSFAGSVGNGNSCYYCVSDQSGANWEVGVGAYTASGSTLSRTTVLASSNAGSLVSFGSNAKDVFVTCPAIILDEIATGGGTVTSVSIVTANGVSGAVANPTTTPAVTLALGAITPSSVAATGTVTGSNLSGANTGNQTITLTTDVTGSGTGSFAATVGAIGGKAVVLGGALTTAGAFTTTLTVTANTNVTLPVSGTLVNTAVTTLSSLASIGTITTGVWNGATIAVANGGTGDASLTAYALLCGGATTTGAIQSIASVGTSGQVLTSNGASALPTFQAPATAGTVTSVSVVSTNGFAGAVATATTTPAITLTTTVTGIIKGNGTAISAAASGTDYVIPSGSITGTAANVTGTVVVANGGTGDTSLTAYTLLCGGTTSTAAIQSVASTGTTGQVLTSNGSSALPTFQTPAVGSGTVNAIFTGTAGVTVANTATETTLLGAGTGSLTPPSGNVAVGYSVRFKASGYWSSLGVAAGNITINLYGNSVLIASTGAVAVPLSLANNSWEVEAIINVYVTAATGIVWTQGRFLSGTATVGVPFLMGMVNTTYAGKTVLAGALNLTATWSSASASNTMTQTNISIDSVA